MSHSTGVRVLMFMAMTVVMVMMLVQMNIELDAGNLCFLTTRNMQVILADTELLQFLFQFGRLDAEVNHRADEHIAADATEYVEIQGFHLHLRLSAFICGQNLSYAATNALI